MIDLGRKNDVFNAGIYTTKDINGFLVEQLDNPSYEHLHSRLQSDLFQWYDLSLKIDQWTQTQDMESLNPNEHDELLQDKIDSLEIDLMFLESFVKDLTSNHMDLTFKDLFSLLLGLSLWPKKFTYDQSLGELQFQQLNQILKKTTLERMKGIYIGHKNHMPDTWRKLAICKAWIEVEKVRARVREGSGNSRIFSGGVGGNNLDFNMIDFNQWGDTSIVMKKISLSEFQNLNTGSVLESKIRHTLQYTSIICRWILR